MIFLVGSPLPSSLDWENDELLNTPIPPFYDIEIAVQSQPVLADLDQSRVKWRVLQSLPRSQSDDIHSTFYFGPEDPNFLTTNQLVKNCNDATQGDSVLSEFYNYSFAMHEKNETLISDLESSTQGSATSSDIVLSIINSSGGAETFEPQTPFQINGTLYDLQDLPTAAHLESIVPQTMSVNLIAGVIAIHPPRRVVTRQWKTEFDIIELVVGDETRTGFGVNIWLPPERSTAAKTKQIDRLRQSLRVLRPQDIVLLRTVGLSSFQNQVYGQTLRGMTQIDLLHRRPVDVTDAGGYYRESNFDFDNLDDDQPLLLQKARRVRKWVLEFTSPTDPVGGSIPGMSTPHGHRLPPDTQ